MFLSHKIIKDGVLQSVLPATTGFGFLYFSDMIPPFKPKNVLILGYGLGTTAQLIKKIWGEVDIMGVDSEMYPNRFKLDFFAQADIKTFLPEIDPLVGYDYIIIDIFNGAQIPEFVMSKEFVEGIINLNPKLIAINTFHEPASEIMHEWDEAFYTSFWKTNSMGNTIHFYSPDAYFDPVKQGKRIS